jgi:hypothetical protein
VSYGKSGISNLQFIITPEFEAYYRGLNKKAGEEKIAKALVKLRKVQGGVIGGSGLNDYENELLGGVSGFEMFGCCAPEGMRAIHTAWINTIDRQSLSTRGSQGVYVNMSFSRPSPWGEVVSFMPDSGRLTVKASVDDEFFLRPPHWAPRDQVHAFVGEKSLPVEWAGAYVRFHARKGDELSITYPLVEFDQQVQGLWKHAAPNLKVSFHWLGNMVTRCDPPARKTALFLGKPRVLPAAPR